MPSGLITRGISTRPVAGEFIVPIFITDTNQGLTTLNPYWYMEHGWESVGPTEDEMVFRVQAQNVSNYAFDIVMNPNGPLQTILFDTPVVGVRFYTDSSGASNYDTIFCGYVSKIRQKSEHSEQYVQFTATSAKKLLRDINVRGSYCWDGNQTTYRDSIPLHMNRGGRPDWTWSDDGIPMPAMNPDWGLGDDVYGVAPSTIQDPTRACYCTLGMILAYLRACYSAEGTDSQDFESARDQARIFFPGLDILPPVFPFNFIWPSTFGQEVDQLIVANFNSGVGQSNFSQGGDRKGRDIRFRNGQPLISNAGEIGVLDTVFAECGSYSYALGYGSLLDNGNSDGAIDVVLRCVPTRFVDGSAALPLYYANGKESAIPTSTVVREIDYTESNQGTYTRLQGIGSPIKIETRIDTSADLTTNPSTGCIFGWNQVDFDTFRFEVALAAGLTAGQIGGPSLEPIIFECLKNFPFLFCRYALDPQYDFTAGTAYQYDPLAAVTRPVWPHLLSYQGQDIQNQANDIVPYPIRLEIDTGDGSGFRDIGFEMDGLVCWENGYFEFQALREIGCRISDVNNRNGARVGAFLWNNEWGRIAGDGGLDISLNDIRLTVAIPHDTTINYAVKTPADSHQRGDENLYGLAPDSPDAARFSPGFNRTMIVDFMKLYDLWLRWSSWPIPESAYGSAQFPDRPNMANAIRNDMAYLKQNCLKSLYERNRLQRDGYFKMIGPLLPNEVYPLGQQISKILPYNNTTASKVTDPFTLNCCIGRREWRTVNMGSPMEPKWTSETKLIPV